PMAVVVVNAPIIGALTTCHPHPCYSPSPNRERGRRFTSCSVTDRRQVRFPNQDVVSKQPETDQPTSHRRICGFRRGSQHHSVPALTLPVHTPCSISASQHESTP